MKPSNKAPFLKLRYIGLVIVVGWAMYEFWYVQAPELSRLNRQSTSLQNQFTALQHQQSTLQTEVKEFQTNQYIAKYATNHFNLILPGQVPFDLGR